MNKYDASSIGVLEGLDAVRKRSGMYIGDPTKAVLQMNFEIVDNVIDEYSMGFGDFLNFHYENGVYTIEDHGRGIPVEMHQKGRPAIEVILSTLHSGGKFNDSNYKYSGGINGVGISVVNALSEYLIAEVARGEKLYTIKYEKGKLKESLKEIGTSDHTGTKIIFKPDLEILNCGLPTKEEIYNRFQELAYLNKGFKINFNYEGETSEILSKGGIQDLNQTMGTPITENKFYFVDETNEVSFFWEDKESENIMCFTNSIYQPDGGSHLTGLRSGIAKVLIPYVEDMVSGGKTKVKKILNEDIKGGLKAVLSIKIQEPKFASQTKHKLVTVEARAQVENFIIQNLKELLEKNPNLREILVKKIIHNAYVRESISRTRESLKKTQIDAFSTLPGKLTDCQSSNPEESELFIVEGDSAGGSAKQGRNRKNQAVLSLRGKLLNVERAHFNKALSCDAIVTLIAALGTGVGKTFDVSKLRYNKVILMTDADPDGLHIRCLLIVFFLKLMPELVENKNIYIARTPLYKISHGKQNKYLQNQKELDEYLLDKFASSNDLEDRQGNKLSKDQIKNLLSECEEFKKFIEKHSINTDKHILSLAMVYDIFNKPRDFLAYMNNIIDGECSLEEAKEGTSLIINSIYGKTVHFIKNYNVNWEIDSFPLIINGEKIYSPLDFLKYYNKKIMQGISIQRYKGLGEMDADELAETSLQPENRFIEPLSTEDLEESLNHMIDVMGNENNRREFVLTHMKNLGFYSDLNLNDI